VEQAIFGLIGVVVGAVLTGGVEWWRERRRENLAGHATLRLLRHELTRARGILAATKNNRVWWPQPWTLPTALWLDERKLLASVIDRDEDWFVISNAFFELEDLNLYLAALREQHGDDVEYESTAHDGRLQDTRDRVSEAMDAVIRLSERPPTRRQRLWRGALAWWNRT
jgi:hypothetical protein